MQKISKDPAEIIEWVQPKTFDPVYELRSGDALLGSLAFRSSFGTFALAETSDGKWSFKRVGFLNPKVTIRVNEGEADIAIYQPRFWTGGVLAFNDGKAYSYKPKNFWHTRWEFTDSDGEAIVAFKRGVEEEKISDMFKTQVTVQINPSYLVRDVPTVLIPLGFYLIILHQRDSAAAAAAT